MTGWRQDGSWCGRAGSRRALVMKQLLFLLSLSSAAGERASKAPAISQQG
jgi:hypothetical protein